VIVVAGPIRDWTKNQCSEYHGNGRNSLLNNAGRETKIHQGVVFFHATVCRGMKDNHRVPMSGRGRSDYHRHGAPVRRYMNIALRVALGVAASAVLIAATVQLLAINRVPTIDRRPEPMVRASYPPAMGEFPTAQPPALSAEPPPELTVYGQMAQEAASARNLREFVEHATKLPEAGGISYAINALAYCNTWHELRDDYLRLEQEAASSSLPAVHERFLTISVAAARCEGFTADQLSRDAMNSLFKSAAAFHDPIITTLSRLQNARTEDDRLAIAREILQMRDPLLLTRAGRLFSQSTASDPPHVDGRRWGGVTPVAYAHAWSLVPCSFGSSCDQFDAEIAVGCVKFGQCYQDRREMLRAKLSSQDYADALRLHARLVEIVANANAEALRPTRN